MNREEIVIRKSADTEYQLVKDFYDSLIDHISELEYGPAWEKGIYPSYEYLYASIQSQQLYIGLIENEIITAMIVNTAGNESYSVANWGETLEEGEFLVIHALGVMPAYTRQGIGRKMVEYVMNELAGSFRAIRLDVLKGNLAANRLYESLGFELCDTIQMYYEDTGWTDFELYEKVLKKSAIKGRMIQLIPASPVLTDAVLHYLQKNRTFLQSLEPVRPEDYYTFQFQQELLKREQQDFAKKKAFAFYIAENTQCEKDIEQLPIIGTIGLSNVVWGPFCSAYLGYKLDQDHLNRGCMTEAVELLVQYAFDRQKLHRIEGNVMPRNKASLRVLEKNGFVNEGISRYYLKINGRWEDHVHMVKINKKMHTQ